MNRPLIIATVIFAFVLIASCDRSTNLPNVNSNDSNAEAGFILTNYCDLVDKAADYIGKNVRVSAILITGREYTYLYDRNCIDRRKFITYDLSDSNAGELLDTLINPQNSEYRKVGLIRVRAVFTGELETRAEGFGPEGFFKYRLIIANVTKAEPVAEDVPYPF